MRGLVGFLTDNCCGGDASLCAPAARPGEGRRLLLTPPLERNHAMTLKIGINGFGRIGRLALRAAWGWPDVAFVHINDPGGDAATLAHLLNFDSVHGRWAHDAGHDGDAIIVDGQRIATSRNKAIADTDWSGCDVVIEASGKMKTTAVLQAYLDQGVKRVVVTAPVKEPGVLNVVMGVNDQLFDPAAHRIVTAASCTTNCLAPVVKVMHENLGIRHGSITTMHDLTNTQSILDQPHKDLRRARACGMSLIPTTTGSATAITEIFPELKGRLNGHAVRVPLANASLTDCGVRGRARHHGRRSQRAVQGRRRRPAQGHPRLRDAAAGVDRLPHRPALGHRRCARSRWWSTAPR